jgi:hypothetical protein
MKNNLCNNCPVRRLDKENIELQRIEEFIEGSPMPGLYRNYLSQIIVMLNNRKKICKDKIFSIMSDEEEKV